MKGIIIALAVAVLGQQSFAQVADTCVSEVETIVVPERGGFDMYSIIDTVCYVRLQTPEDMPIGEIGKVVADEDRLFALDNKNNLVFTFSGDGEYLGQIGSKEAVPGPYSQLKDITLDTKKKLISLLVRGGFMINVVRTYDYDGRLVDEAEFQGEFGRIEHVGDGMAFCRYFKNETSPASATDGVRLSVLDSRKEPLYGCFPFSDTPYDSLSWHSARPLNAVGGEVLYHQFLMDTIWQVTDSLCRALYYIDLPQKNPLSGKYAVRNDRSADEYMAKGPAFGGIYTYNKDYMSFTIVQNRIGRPLLYDRHSRHVLYGYPFTSPRHSLFEALCPYAFDFSDGEYFIHIVPPYLLFSALTNTLPVPVLTEQEKRLVDEAKDWEYILVKVKLKGF